MDSIGWESLPLEIQTHIIWFLSLPEILAFRVVSKKFKLCCDNEITWKHEVQKISGSIKCPKSWRELYISHYKSFVWSSENKGPHIQLDSSQRQANSLREGGWSNDRKASFYWQCVISKHAITPELNYAEFKLEQYDATLINTRGIMIGIDYLKNEVSSSTSPCWIGLNGGWGYAAKSGELFTPGSRSNHLSKRLNKGYKEGDVIGILFDFDNKELAFFVNNELHGTEKLEKKYWQPEFHFAFAAAHGDSVVSFQVPKFRQESILKYQKSISVRSPRQVPTQTD